MKLIEASILAFNKKTNEFKKTAKRMFLNDIKNIHYDVMDGIFVPNVAYNGEKIRYLKRKGFKISVHLMVVNVKEYVEKFIKYNIDYLTFHCEPLKINESIELINLIKSNGIKAGIAIKPNTIPGEYSELIEMSDIITIMGVEPGFGGQKFIPKTVELINKIKKYAKKDTILQLDGGVNLEIIKMLKNDINFFVSGSFLVNYDGDLKELNNILKN